MPVVPTYSRNQVAPSSMPQARLGVPDMPDVAGQQTQQMSQAMLAGGRVAGLIATDVQNEANQLRVDSALLKVEEAANRLATDPQQGFLQQRGEAALKRSSGKPLAEDYGEMLKRHVDEIGGELGNDAQRMVFQARASRVLAGFQKQASMHELKEHNAWADNTDDATLRNKQTQIGNHYDKPMVVEAIVNGLKNDKGELVEEGMRQVIERKAKRHGMPPEWVAAEVDKATFDAHRDVVTRMMDGDPIKAFEYVQQNADKLGPHLPGLQKAVRPAYDRAVGQQRGDAIYRKGGPASADADSVIDWVIAIEGGYVANDAGKGETKFGINKTANPDVDVKNLTPEQAKALYRERYWNGIGADKLPKEMRAVAFDTAVNMGVSTANRLMAASGGDPAKMIELRRQEYAALIEKNPAKFKRYEAAWSSRLDKLAGLVASGGDRSLPGLLKEAEQIEDREQRSVAMAHIRQQHAIDEAEKKEAYDNNFKAAMDIAWPKPGGWREIPASSWATIKPEDRAKLMEPPKKSDPDTLLHLMENPQLWKAGKIEQFRPLLSEADYRQFHSKANGPGGDEKIREVSIDSEQFKYEMQRAGLEKWLTAKKDTPEQKQLIELRAKFENVIDSEQQARGRKLSIDEKNALLNRLIKPVKVSQVRTGSLFGLFDGPTEAADMRAFQVKNPANIRIPDETRSRIIADMRSRGITPTDSRVLAAYLATSEEAAK